MFTFSCKSKCDNIYVSKTKVAGHRRPEALTREAIRRPAAEALEDKAQRRIRTWCRRPATLELRTPSGAALDWDSPSLRPSQRPTTDGSRLRVAWERGLRCRHILR